MSKIEILLEVVRFRGYFESVCTMLGVLHVIRGVCHTWSDSCYIRCMVYGWCFTILWWTCTCEVVFSWIVWPCMYANVEFFFWAVETFRQFGNIILATWRFFACSWWFLALEKHLFWRGRWVLVGMGTCESLTWWTPLDLCLLGWNGTKGAHGLGGVLEPWTLVKKSVWLLTHNFCSPSLSWVSPMSHQHLQR